MGREDLGSADSYQSLSCPSARSSAMHIWHQSGVDCVKSIYQCCRPKRASRTRNNGAPLRLRNSLWAPVVIDRRRQAGLCKSGNPPQAAGRLSEVPVPSPRHPCQTLNRPIVARLTATVGSDRMLPRDLAHSTKVRVKHNARHIAVVVPGQTPLDFWAIRADDAAEPTAPPLFADQARMVPGPTSAFCGIIAPDQARRSDAMRGDFITASPNVPKDTASAGGMARPADFSTPMRGAQTSLVCNR